MNKFYLIFIIIILSSCNIDDIYRGIIVDGFAFDNCFESALNSHEGNEYIVRPFII